VTARGIAPAWSSRGWNAFLRADGVYRVRPDGRGLRRLAARTHCSDVAWSPSGTALAVVPFDGGVVTMRPDGNRQRGLVEGGYSSMGALGAGGVAWQPRIRPAR
jgi:hypothetical protein